VFVSWTTCVGNEQKILRNIAVNIMGTQVSDAEATVAFNSEKKVCSLLISLLGKVVKSSERSERSERSGKEKNQTVLPAINHRSCMSCHHI
jgi:hypothetical protein